MEANIEQTKQEELVQSTEMAFYTVSQKKFLILFLGTFGIYAVLNIGVSIKKAQMMIVGQ